jgi:hypothetical protein
MLGIKIWLMTVAGTSCLHNFSFESIFGYASFTKKIGGHILAHTKINEIKAKIANFVLMFIILQDCHVYVFCRP